MSVVPPAGTHSYCTEGEFLLATPIPLYVLALACRGPTFLNTYLLPQQSVHKVRNSADFHLKMDKIMIYPFIICNFACKFNLYTKFMKQPLLILISIIAFASCSEDREYRTNCPKDEMYHEHSFIPLSVYPTSELGYDNWLTSKCKKCGILLKYNTDIETEVHYGAIHLFKSPKTGEFDDLCVCWVEGEYNKPHYKTISKSDLRIRKK